jgi:hypothetical protein
MNIANTPNTNTPNTPNVSVSAVSVSVSISEGVKMQGKCINRTTAFKCVHFAGFRD